MKTDITSISATEIAQRIRDGGLSALEAVEAHIARIEAVNPALNAVVVTRFDAARNEARTIDARRGRGEPLPPLAGVPVTVKESIDLEGLPSTFGIQTRADHRAPEDDVHVARLRAAGAIVLGKTNVSQCLIYTEADNPVYGRTNNPWNPQRSCGGSSGGEGAIIAAGGSPMGLGTDIGGSVRLPAHFCGIAGLKPTSGRMDDPGRGSVPVGQRAIPSQIGVLARHVADVALGIEIANGGPQPEIPGQHALGDWSKVDVSTLRVAYYTNDGTIAPAPALSRAVEEAAEALRQAGAEVTAWAPPIVPEALTLFGRILLGDGVAGMRRSLKGSAKAPQVAQLLLSASIPGFMLAPLRGLLRSIGQHTMASNLEAAGPVRAIDYWDNLEAQIDYRQEFADALDAATGGPFDLILAPPSSLPAFTHGASRDLLTAGAYASLYNLLGYPAGVVPFTRIRNGEETDRDPGRDLVLRLAQKVETDSAGLPVGVQVIARPWQEHIALAAMAALETAARQQPDFPQTPVAVAF
jgi:fatty acid amide hydrolase